MAKAPKNTLAIGLSNVLSRSAMGAAIESIKLEGKKYDQSIQIALVSGALHAHKHGDFDLLNQIIASLSAGLRTNAARDWVLEFGPVKWDKKKKAFIHAPSKVIANIVSGDDADSYAMVEETKAKLEKMLNTDWLSFRPEKDFKPSSAAETLEKMIGSLEKKEGKGKDGIMHDVHAEDLAVLRAALDQLKANAGRRALAAPDSAVNSAAVMLADAEANPNEAMQERMDQFAAGMIAEDEYQSAMVDLRLEQIAASAE